MSHDQNNSLEVQRFLRLYLANQKRIFGFIVSMVPNWTDADDILQDTTEVMWRKFSDFEPGTNFAAWGIKIARLHVFREYRKSHSPVKFDSETLELLSADYSGVFDKIDNRVSALQDCLKQLPDKQRDLIKMRYDQVVSVKEIAERVNKPAHTIYKMLSRIHESLMFCIRHKLRTEEVL